LAVLMNQGMVSSRRKDGVVFWAWMASIAVHLTVLMVFGIVKFSPSRQQAWAKQRPVPLAKVSQIKKFLESAPVIPKPKIKKSAEGRVAGMTNILLPANQTFGTVKPSSQAPARRWQELVKSSTSTSKFLPGSTNLSPRIEFFGSWTEQRKVCYVVDCSGSMQGMFGRVREKLTESIKNLQPDQYFNIIFFGSGRIFEFGDGRLVRATEQTKLAAYEFIKLVQPAGQTNALAALERAVQVRDSSGISPSIIYFLTDGFELTTEDAHRFNQKIANLLKRFAPTTKVNTIGFWPRSDDRQMLKTIAKQSGGECVFVADQ